MNYNMKTGMYEGYIYKISNKINNKLYIGQTVSTLEERWRNHKSDANSINGEKFAIHLAMGKYGVENFSITAIEKVEGLTKDQLTDKLNEREVFYISKFSTICPYGYNLTPGGNSGNIRDYKPVTQYDLDGKYINHYESMALAASITGCNRKAISMCCKHQLKTSGGFIWEYEGVKPRKVCFNKFSLYKVDQYTIDGVFVKTFDSARDASTEVDCPIGNIHSACNGNRKTSRGFVWRKHGEPFNKYIVGKSA